MNQLNQAELQKPDYTCLATRFGELFIDEERVLFFPEGIIGFPDFHHYALLPLPGQDGFFLLQCLDETWLSFVILPTEWAQGENSWIQASDIQKKAEQFLLPLETLMLGLIVTIDEKEGVSANLKAPIFIESQTKKAWQVILDNASYAVCFPLPQD